MSTFVRFWGTRGSIPTPGLATRRFGGNTSCYEVRFDDVLVICDGGTGLRDLGVDLMQRSPSPVEAHMIFSHTHWDHIQGFPFFPPAYVKHSRLFVYDVEEDDKRIHRLLHGQMRAEYFPVDFKELQAAITSRELRGDSVIEGIRVEYLAQDHPGGSFAFSFAKNGCKVVYATDSELDRILLNREESLADLEVIRRAPDEVLAFIAGADLLIADGQYSDSEYREKAGWGHARANTVVDLAVQAGVKQVAITHHDPMHSDEAVDQMVHLARQRAASRGSDAVFFGAREGLEMKLA
jgi:phosphoribosyl 1,2-cyclic phosphodiesterase